MTANNVINQSKGEGKACTWRPEQEKSLESNQNYFAINQTKKIFVLIGYSTGTRASRMETEKTQFVKYIIPNTLQRKKLRTVSQAAARRSKKQILRLLRLSWLDVVDMSTKNILWELPIRYNSHHEMSQFISLIYNIYYHSSFHYLVFLRDGFAFEGYWFVTILIVHRLRGCRGPKSHKERALLNRKACWIRDVVPWWRNTRKVSSAGIYVAKKRILILCV